ncbi:MAG: hypothetical protein A2W22_04140 [Candidatus Levybacteria bacterium RBG_16_35_11]|nr:MAG: hypothetical protein A2W22_04140 [Candidatus Levybacteria bacterium RBG_16_35_11]
MLLKKKFLILTAVFIFSVALRIWNLNEMGRTWDEITYVKLGYNTIQLIKSGNYWKEITNTRNELTYHFYYELPDPPPLERYLYGLAAQFDVERISDGEPVFFYDLTYSRLVSVFFSSFAIITTLLIGWEFISPFVGISSSLLLSTLPIFLGYSQIATLESMIVFFFTASVYSFLKTLRKKTVKRVLLTGLLFGLALSVKYTNILLLPLFIWVYLIWNFHRNKKEKFWSLFPFLLAITGAALVVFFMLWPFLWFHLKEIYEFENNFRVLSTRKSIPEFFFGKLILVPNFYYIIYFAITTPLAILFVFYYGCLMIAGTKFSYFKLRRLFTAAYCKSINFKNSVLNFFLLTLLKDRRVLDYRKENNWVLPSLVVWFIIPFLLSFYNFRQHGVRYIIEIYIPLSLITGIGIEALSKNISIKKYSILFLLILYLIIADLKISPYYLDYFNLIAGGTKGVYESKMYQMGWWGQGLREAGLYLEKNAKRGSSVGVAAVPFESFPPSENLKIFKYENDKKYDYVVVSFFNVVREGFNDSSIKIAYSPVYNVLADGASLVTVYKAK